MPSASNRADAWRRIATSVDTILQSAQPADLPVERAVKFDLVIHRHTAQGLGSTIPPSLLCQAARGIQEAGPEARRDMGHQAAWSTGPWSARHRGGVRLQESTAVLGKGSMGRSLQAS